MGMGFPQNTSIGRLTMRKKWRNRSFYLLIMLILCVSASIADETKSVQQMKVPDALIWISATSQAGTSVSITFANVISEERAQQYLANLLKETGWSAQNIVITSDKASNENKNPMTSIEFQAPQFVITPDGNFILEPFIKAFRDLKNIQILIMTYPNFQYKGFRNFENKYVKISLTESTNSYNFSIDIKNPNFTNLGLPSISDQTSSQKGDYGIAAWQILVIIIIAIAVAVGAYIITKKFTKTNSYKKD